MVRLLDFNIFLTIICALPLAPLPPFYPGSLSLELIFNPNYPHSYPALPQPYGEGLPRKAGPYAEF